MGMKSFPSLAGGTGNIDDLPSASFHVSDSFIAEKKRPLQIHIKCLIPLARCHGTDRPVFPDTGVVHQDVDSSEVVDDLSKNPPHLAFRCHIYSKSETLFPQMSKSVAKPLCLLSRRRVRDRNSTTGLCQHDSSCSAD